MVHINSSTERLLKPNCSLVRRRQITPCLQKVTVSPYSDIGLKMTLILVLSVTLSEIKIILSRPDDSDTQTSPGLNEGLVATLSLPTVNIYRSYWSSYKPNKPYKPSH